MVNAVKVALRSAQDVKKKLMKAQLFDNDYSVSRDEGFLLIPVTDAEQAADVTGCEVVDVELAPYGQVMSLREALTDRLTPEELDVLKTSFDTVGSIAILEIDEKLLQKEKLIAEMLLSINQNIKTVLKKGGIHDGKFRTQNMVYLAGEKTKETLHKENGVRLLVNVEEVYFSPRLSTERKRISELVRKDEDILVMFSGCAPYPCVLSHNTPARHIVGVEMNPIGHAYGMKNVRLNKLHNVVLVKGDVHEVVPNLYHYIVGLKSSDNESQLDRRLVHHPVLMELHLNDTDLFEGREKLEETIRDLQEKGIHVVLHMPFGLGGKRYSLGQADVTREMKMFTVLGKMCVKYHIKAVVHPTQQIGIAEDEDMLVKHIKMLSPWFDYFQFENVTHGLFAKWEDIVRIGKKAGIRNMTIDTCHLFIVYQDNDMIEEHIKEVQKHFNTYFHLNDHDYKTHSCEIGKGYIDWKRVLPYVTVGVTEVCDKDENHPWEMVRSWLNVTSVQRRFDRILMPLPKSAEDFLDTALAASKEGTVIHFYDFLHVDEFDRAKEKIDAACKRNGVEYEILELVKCGQHSPRTFRICVDFRIIRVTT